MPLKEAEIFQRMSRVKYLSIGVHLHLFGEVRGFIVSQWMLVVAHISQLLLTLTCEVRPVHSGKKALDPSFALISTHQ